LPAGWLREFVLVFLAIALLAVSLPARATDVSPIPPDIEKLLALPEDKIDIGIAALTFAHDVDSGTDIQANLNK